MNISVFDSLTSSESISSSQFPFSPSIVNISLQSSSTSVSGFTFSNPGVNPGDLMLVHIMHRGNGGTEGFGVPSGWTRIGSGVVSTSFVNMGLYWKVASASEASTYSFTFLSGGAAGAGAFYWVINNDTGSPIAASSDSTTTSSPGAITPGVHNTALVYFGGSNTSGAGGSFSSFAVANNNPPNWVTLYNVNDGSANQDILAAGSVGYFSSTTTGAVTASGPGSNSSIVIAIAPLPSAQVLDSSTISESVTVRLTSFINAFEIVSDTDVVSIQKILQTQVADTIALTELLLLPFKPIIEEGLTISEFVSVFLPFLSPAVSDQIHLAELVQTDSVRFGSMNPSKYPSGYGNLSTPRGIGKNAY